MPNNKSSQLTYTDISRFKKGNKIINKEIILPDTIQYSTAKIAEALLLNLRS